MKALVFCLLAGWAGLGLGADEHGPHVHGVASLTVALDGERLELSFDSPLDNLLGFERAPRSDKEREMVRAMAQRFHQGEKLFVTTPGAGCIRDETILSSPVLPATLLAAPGAPPSPAASEPEGHADLQATLVFRCSKPQALKGLRLVQLFGAFPRLREVNAEVAAGRAQTGGKLTPKSATLGW